MDYDPQNNVFSQSLHFQIPSFVCSATPTLAPGGGAEVLPLSLLSGDNSLAHSWFSNNGFTPQFSSQDSKADDSQQSSSASYGPPERQQQQPQSSSAPFDFDSYTVPSIQTPPDPQSLPRPLTAAEISTLIQPLQNPSALLNPHHLPSSDLPAPSPLGLPVYSASGFDLLSILARVANRPDPRVTLGPVDLTCSFVVVDVRRFDHPIVYCSPTFCRLTGYSENEILGRNCRFLQAPNGQVQRGETRSFTDHSAVLYMKKNLSADKECQISIVNYKKDGTAFINLVTVIPILGGVSGAPQEESEVVYHVGFQVDLTKQPNAILEKLRDGSYISDYGIHHHHRGSPLSQPSSCIGGPHNFGHFKDRKSQVIPSVRISRDLKMLLADPSFVKSIPITTTTTLPPSQTSVARAEAESSSSSLSLSTSITGHNQLLHLMLLEASPDFIHVVSLKGTFLYVAPSVRRVLGYEPEEMLGGSISDYAHPEDVVPLMRELKEGSATGLSALSSISAEECGSNDGGITAATDQSQHHHHLHAGNMQMAPRTVDLLFRARTTAGVYVWIECKGRLHVEPGKGRKAIVLSGRAKEMPKLNWHCVAQNGLCPLAPLPRPHTSEESEVWGTMTNGRDTGGVVSFLLAGSAISDVLGWTSAELTGREVVNFIVEGANVFMDEISILEHSSSSLSSSEGGGYSNPRPVCCTMRHKNGSTVPVVFVLFRPSTHDSSDAIASIKGIIRAPLIYQLRTFDSTTSTTTTTLSSSSSSRGRNLVHPLTSDVFEELDTNRDSSWQYELQQLRFANQRLEDEIAALSEQLEKAEDMQQKVLEDLEHTTTTTTHDTLDPYTQSNVTTTSSAPFDYPPPPPHTTITTTSHPVSQDQYLQQHCDLAKTQSQHLGPFSPSPLHLTTRDWDSSMFTPAHPGNNNNTRSLKRAWGDDR